MGCILVLGLKSRLNMNKILFLLFGVSLFLALSVASSTEEDTSLAQEDSAIRHVRDAEAGRRRKGKGKKKRAKKVTRGKGRKKQARKGKGRKKPAMKGKGKKNSRKTRRKPRKGGNRRQKKGRRTGKRNNRRQGGRRRSGRQNSTSTNSTSSGGVACLSAAVKYMKQWKDVVGNFKRQNARSTKHSAVGDKKVGKKAEFLSVALRLVEAGGDNRSNLSCAGATGNDGAKQLQNLTKLLFDCEKEVNTSCNPANYPKLNTTLVSTCENLTKKFETEAETCMKKTVGKTTEAEYTEACMCWEMSTFATMSGEVGDCKIQDAQKLITKQKTACTSAFAKCRKYEDEAVSVMATCTSSQDKLKAKAAALSNNNKTLTAAKEKMSSLAGTSTGRKFRATATTCAEVISKSKEVTVLVSQSPQSSQISVLALEISSVTSSVTCSDAEKTSITTQISEVESAISMISDALEAVQEQIKTLTGSTASVSVAETTTMSTKAPSSSASARRDRILKTILQKSA